MLKGPELRGFEAAVSKEVIDDNDLEAVLSVYLDEQERDARYSQGYRRGRLIYDFRSDPKHHLPRILGYLVSDSDVSASFNVADKMLYDKKLRGDLLRFVRTRPRAKNALAQQIRSFMFKKNNDAEDWLREASASGQNLQYMVAYTNREMLQIQRLDRLEQVVRASEPSPIDLLKDLVYEMLRYLMPERFTRTTLFQDIQPTVSQQRPKGPSQVGPGAAAVGTHQQPVELITNNKLNVMASSVDADVERGEERFRDAVDDLTGGSAAADVVKSEPKKP